MPNTTVTPILQSIEWVAAGLRFDLGSVPHDPELLSEWAKFWRELRVRLEGRGEVAAYLRQHVTVVLDSKAFAPNEQQMFAGRFCVESALADVESDLHVEDMRALSSGILLCDVCVRFDLSFARESGLDEFCRLLKNDPIYVWDRVLISGPVATVPDLDGATTSVHLVGPARSGAGHAA